MAQIMPYTEKKEREKLIAAMQVYRAFIYSSIVAFVGVLYSGIVHRFAWFELAFIIATGQAFILFGLGWHFKSLRKQVIFQPYDCQSRPKIVAIIILLGLVLHLNYAQL